MLLAVDVGNTNMVFGIFREDKLAGTFRLQTDVNRTSDEIGLLSCAYFERFGLDPRGVEDILIASVVPPVMYALTSAMIKYFGKTPRIIDAGVDPGLPYAVKGDERLGADRSVACVAAIHAYGAPLIVLDFGTATTVDAINREGGYLGGCILAGVRLTTQALFQKTAQLPNVELTVPDKVLNSTAVGQIQAGAVGGYIGAIEYLIRRTKEEMGYPPDKIQVIATGGLARMVADHTDAIDRVDGGLILEGLRIISKRN